uniref:non-specific serine/threonine protein kinase n=1 Tax=Gasterosteus aculeatus TaxID=69293 RepID=G3PLX9_GASAC
MDKYEKVKKIGEGSFGKAILVKSKQDGRQYVIKEIGISAMSSKERQESRKEVAVLANMSHPNIVQYKESFEEGGCLYIVMDYCEGGDLFKKINTQKGVLFSEEQILDWFVQICLALKHVHDRKILHRDIKSQNIFLTKDGTVQLGDFGIARVLNSTVELARTCIGTPYYLSPEICENKPYNNKSDIWALGCVLYEMCTLKHAFEAGNMKNLVLKIIRGSYPPVSVHYSQELRSLLAALFKRSPRERPSVSGVLDKPFLTCRIQRFLTPQVIAQEFRHNFLHKQPKVGSVQGPSAKRPAPASTPLNPSHKITKPASKYGVPLAARKVSDAARRPAVKHKAAPHPAAPQRRGSQVEEERKKREDVLRKSVELIEKERKRREQVFLLKAEQMKRYEKEKIDRINQAREQGWKHVLSSSGGSSPERKCFAGGGKVFVPTSVQGASKTPYEHHHAALDQMANLQAKVLRREGPSAGPGSPTRPRGHAAAGRAHQVEEFLQRKREAILNKVRAEGQLEYLSRLRQIRLQNFNERQQIKARLRGEKYDSDGSDSQESSEEAEQRRKKIEALKAQANARAAVLKEQLEKKRKEAQEREKRAWEDHKLAARGMKVGIAAAENVAAASSSSTSDGPLPQPSPSPPEPAAKAPARPAAISMTAALKNVGAVRMHLSQITPLKEKSPEPEKTTVIQSEKRQILRRLNQNLKAQGLGEEGEESLQSPAPQQNQPAAETRPPSNGDRKKWDAAELPVLPAAQLTLEETFSSAASSASPDDGPCSAGDRRKWEAGIPLVLSVAQQTLEETCIRTIVFVSEQTAGEVIRMAALQEEAPRKVWGANPDPQVLRVLQEAELQPLTQQLEGVAAGEIASPGQSSFSLSRLTQRNKPDQAATPAVMKASNEEFSSVPSPEVRTAPTSEATVADEEKRATPMTMLSEAQDPADVESVVLDEKPKPARRPPAGVQQAWGPEAQQPMPPEGVATPAGEAEGSAEKPCDPPASAHSEAPLFIKLCSPAHRRTAALALLSAQSSVDESSSSLASRSRSVSPLRSKHHDALLIGLSTGMFDANNPKMLRTCSLPDLGRLFSPRQDSAVVVGGDAHVVPDDHLEVEDLEDAAKDDDQSETEDAFEDEDLRDIRASMERLLHEEGDMMRTSSQGDAAGDYNGNPRVLFNRIAAELDEDHNQMAVDDDDGEDGSNGSPSDEEAGELLNNGVGGNHSNNSRLNEEWQSDGSGEEQDGGAAHHDSIFSRLEELRFDLEQQMGFEKFIEAYNKIKASHEDEDESIDLGSGLVLNILGTEHQHLYPNILHLVMADGAYQEGCVIYSELRSGAI